jgi:hypothetical protein
MPQDFASIAHNGDLALFVHVSLVQQVMSVLVWTVIVQQSRITHQVVNVIRERKRPKADMLTLTVNQRSKSVQLERTTIKKVKAHLLPARDAVTENSQQSKLNPARHVLPDIIVPVQLVARIRAQRVP